jgi:hypothetical protein
MTFSKLRAVASIALVLTVGRTVLCQAGAVSVTTELSVKVDTKSAAVGQAVATKLSQSVKLPDGTQLPKGTALTGHVAQVQAANAENGRALLAITFDQAELKGGKNLPVTCTLTAIAPPPAQGDLMAAATSSFGGGASTAANSTPTYGTAVTANSSSGITGSDSTIPGVMLSAGTLTAAKKNIVLEKGSKLTIAVVAQ